ncbi:AAA family ATPase [Sphingomonas cannabina]|uniref:AAA family ATPase n=1 Tax=Sphingomonas cannabina TaxID=2899123 RepID=UPI0029E7EF90|nr:AAA family ATPase [Sphingomonas cannabina]
MIPTDRLHVVTGGPGSGKTTLIEALAAAGIATSPEVGRAVIKEQLATGGTALPWGDELAFAEEMLVRDVAAQRAALASGRVTMMDRGVPDVVGFLRVSNLPVPPHIDAAAHEVRYNARVFIAPFWAEIYAHDAERKQSPELAEATQAAMVETYRSYGYVLVELPRVGVAERVAFVRAAIGA